MSANLTAKGIEWASKIAERFPDGKDRGLIRELAGIHADISSKPESETVKGLFFETLRLVSIGSSTLKEFVERLTAPVKG